VELAGLFVVAVLVFDALLIRRNLSRAGPGPL
jgi:hypothetical protein